MNAQTSFIRSRAVTRAMFGKPDFAQYLREEAKQTEADLKSGKLIATSAGLMTPHDWDCRVETDGGCWFPTLSVGHRADAWRMERGQ